MISVFYQHLTKASEQTGRPLSDVLREAASYGIEGVEINIREFDGKPEIYKKLLSDAGLTVSCLCSNNDFAHGNELSAGFEAIDTALFLDTDKVLFIPGFVEDGDDRNAVRENIKEALTTLSAYGKEKGVTVLMEDYDGSNVVYASMNEIRWFYDNVPDLYCAFDTGNFLFSEEDVLTAYPLLKDKIRHVHCKDRRLTPVADEKAKLTVKAREIYASPFGEGCIPAAEIISLLLSDGYAGNYAIEHFDSPDMLGYMKRSAEWLKKKLK